MTSTPPNHRPAERPNHPLADPLADRPAEGRLPEAPLAGLPEPAAILFDLDGTLVDTVQLRIDGWEQALGRHGISVGRELIAAHIGADGRRLAREMGRLSGRELDWAESDEIDRLSGSIFDELNNAPQPLPGARELLAALEASDLTFAIATASQPGQVAVSVAALELPSPPRIIDAGHVEHAKPEPDLLLVAAEQLGVPPGSCWYVGDSTWDMIAAERAGMSGVGVATGAVDSAALLAAGAAVSMASLTELLESLRECGLLPDPAER
jgi:HAD superfamily hydrolase (TIGR01509 family)